MRGRAPDLLSLCTCDLDFTSRNADNSSQGGALYQIRGKNHHRNRRMLVTTIIIIKISLGTYIYLFVLRTTVYIYLQ